MVRVLIVDDHPLFRAGLASVLQQHRDMEVVGEASNAIEAVEQTAKKHPDIVTMDVYMRGGDGFEGTAMLREKFPEVKILILSMSNNEEDLFRLVKNGAHGYLLKTADASELVDSIRKIASGDTALSATMATKLLERFRSAVREDSAKDMHGLSPREREVLQLAAKGATNKEIADKCFISETTVKAHFRSILEKLGTKNRAGAVAIATSKGLLKERGY